MFQRGPTYEGIRIFSYLPTNLKDLSSNVEQFKKALKEFLLYAFVYTTDEFFMCKIR